LDQIEIKIKKNVELKKFIIDEFSSESTQQIYIKDVDIGLWNSEKIVINKYFKAGSSILDIGCGTGRTTIELNKMKYKVFGIDITPKMIENAILISKEKKCKIRYKIGDATNLNFKNNQFDNALFSFNGLTQIPSSKNRIKAIQEINRILKKGGIFIFTTNLRNQKGYRFLWMLRWIKFYILGIKSYNSVKIEYGDFFFNRGSQKQYIHIPSLRKMFKIIKSNGFEIIFHDSRENISEIDKIDYSLMFYVCKKI